MGWNEPKKGKNPWNGKEQPPDLDEVLKRFQEKLKKTFLKRGGQSKDKSSPDKSGGALLVVIVALVAFILWALSGIFIVDPAEQAVILRFGKYISTVGPGPHWIPRIISSKIVQNVDRVADYSYSAQMLTQDENLVSVAVAVRYRIGDLREYLFNVADPQESLQQATSSALRQVIAATTLDQIITEGREAWEGNVQETLIKILDKYKTGIVIVSVSPQSARAPENVQDAFDDAIKAQEDGKRFKEQALAYQARVVPTAEGNTKRIIEEAKAFSEKIVLQAKGEVAEFLAILPQYLQAPQVTSERMYLDSMQRVLSRSSKILVDSKANNLLYLPLDKMMSPPNPSAVTTPDKGTASAENANGDAIENALVEDRSVVRRTYSQGRN